MDFPVNEQYMSRAIQLAQLGMGSVSPNPMVGCVIEKNGLILAEGWHKRYGGPHAEVEAIQALAANVDLSEACAYVSLEPCSHVGKTPPCSDLLISKGIGKVVVAQRDPNPKVAGAGIEKLRKAGIPVVEGVLEKEAGWLNRRFLTYQLEKRPYIILKWSQTADGFIARKNFDSKWISNPWSRALVHKWRAEEDAILVGYRTALHDNPQLSVRDWPFSKQPLRIMLDRELQLPHSHHAFDGSQKTWLVHGENASLNKRNEQVFYSQAEGLSDLLSQLFHEGCASLLVEGGSATLSNFMEANLWDEARIFTAEGVNFQEGIPAPQVKGEKIDETYFKSDRLSTYRNFNRIWQKA